MKGLLGCPRKLGSMVGKWVITYAQKAYIGVTTHLPFTNFLGHPTMIQKNGKETIPGPQSFPLNHDWLQEKYRQKGKKSRSHLEVPIASISAIQNFWNIGMIFGVTYFPTHRCHSV